MKPTIAPGDRFFKLTVIERAGSKDGRSAWRLRCDCGKQVVRISHNLKRDRSSCGCAHPQSFRKGRVSETLTHGHARRGVERERLYSVWQGIKRRCLNPTHKSYADYGGRGIRICDEWVSDYPAFATWAHANGYRQGLQIDRRDNDGPYAPSNCQFVTKDQNNRNTRLTVWIAVGGERMTLHDAQERFGVSSKLIALRLRRGASPENAVRPAFKSEIVTPDTRS